MNKDEKEVKALAELQTENDRVTQAKLAVTDEIRLAQKYEGRREITSSLTKLLTCLDLFELKRIKESKSFKHLVNQESPDGSNFSSWKDYCEISVGESHKTIDEKLLDYKTWGEKGYESLNELNYSVRNRRALRKLPDDKKEEARILAEEKDIEGLNDLLAETQEKEIKLKKALEKVTKDKEQEEKASSNLLAKKDKKLNDLSKELNKRSIDLGKWDENVADLQLKIAGVSTEIKEAQAKLVTLLDFIPQINMPKEHQEKITELLGMSYWNASNEAFIDASDTMAVADQLYGGYAGKGRAVPLLEDVLADKTIDSDEK